MAMREEQGGQNQSTSDDDPMTREEFAEWFGSEIPIEVIDLLFKADGSITVREMRGQIKRMAAEHRKKQNTPEARAQRVFYQLADDPAVWRTHGLPGEEKERLIVAAIANAIWQAVEDATRIGDQK